MKKTLIAAALAGVALAPGAALADWPADRPIRMIVSLTPGSATDIVGRLVADVLTQRLGQSVVVENRPGAGTTLASGQVAAAAPDGYTLLVTSSAHSAVPALYPNLSYDPVTGLVPVAALGETPLVLAANPTRGYDTLADLVRIAQETNGGLNFGTVGTGTAGHLPAESLMLEAGFEALHIPYSGAPEALQEVANGQVDFYFSPLPPALPLIRDGRVVPLVVSGLQRAAALPDVPTTTEAGYPATRYVFWAGMFAPAGTPDAIVERLNAEVQAALADPAVAERLANIHVQSMPMNAAEFQAFIAGEMEANADLVQRANITLN